MLRIRAEQLDQVVDAVCYGGRALLRRPRDLPPTAGATGLRGSKGGTLVICSCGGATRHHRTSSATMRGVEGIERDLNRMTVAERLEVSALIAGLVADITAATIDASPAVAEWLTALHSRLLPITEGEFEELMRLTLGDGQPAEQAPGGAARRS